ncbi:MAG: T9SS type A sorting domain-containing protein [bacterium]|nr:T9SS type A sorting domain-containing protein [bacterium]
MKKLLVFIIFGLSSSMCYGANIIQNSSFEQWHDTLGFSVPNSWITAEIMMDPDSMLTRVIKSTHSHTGSYAAKVEKSPGEGYFGGLYTIVNVVGGTSYNLSFYYDCSSISVGFLMVSEISATDTIMTIGEGLFPTSGYTLYDTSFTTMSTTTEIFLGCAVSGEGDSAQGDSIQEVYFDDVELTGQAVEEKYINSYGKSSLSQSLPNPFNKTTEIKYTLPKETNVCINIYDISGQKIKTLVNGKQEAGCKSAYWDGLNDKRETVENGIYFYQIEAGGYKETKKLVLMR